MHAYDYYSISYHRETSHLIGKCTTLRSMFMYKTLPPYVPEMRTMSVAMKPARMDAEDKPT